MASRFKSLQPHHWRNAAIVLALFVTLIAVAVLFGWAFHISALKSGIPGLAAMKANTALGLLLSGIALLLILMRGGFAYRRITVIFLAMILFLLSTATLTEYFLDFDLKIDQALFTDSDSIETARPGRMSPSSAFCFLVVAAALLLLTREKSPLRLPIASALGVTLTLIGTLNLLGQLSNYLLGWQWWNYSGVALHTAACFIFIGLALMAFLRSEIGVVWSLSNLMTTGFTICIVSLLAIGTISFHFTKRLQQTSILVYHTHDVLKEIENARAAIANLESTQRGFLILGRESMLQGRDAAKKEIQANMKAIRTLTADNPIQQEQLNRLEHLISERTAFGDLTIETRKNQGWPSAQALVATGKGIGLTENINLLLKNLRDEEYRLGVLREENANGAVTSTFLFLPLGIFLSLAMVLCGVFLLNAGISEKQQAESQVAYQASLLAQVNDAIIAVDHRSQITVWNQAAEDLYGWKAAETIGRPSKEIVRSEMTPETRERILLQLREEGSYRNELVQYRRDGSPIRIETNTIALRNKDGSFSGIISVNRDITERKEIESQVKYQANLLSQINDAVIAVDVESRITAWNHAAENLYGWSEAEVRGKPSSQIVQSLLSPEARQKIWQQIIDEGSCRNEFVQVHRDGTVLHVEGNTIALRDEHGNFKGVLSVNRDISERKREEARRMLSEERYRALFETLIEGFCTIELIFDEKDNPTDFRFIEVNPAFEKQTGLKDAPGKLMSEATPGLEQYWLDTYAKVALSGEALQFENEAKILGRQYYVCAYRVGGEDSRKVAILFNDITERKKAEEKILHLNAELEQRVMDRTRELLSQTSKLQQLIESSPDAIITLDLARQRVTSWNSSAETMYGYTAAEAVGKTTEELVKTERVGTTAENVARSFAETGRWQGEIIQQTKHGKELYLLCSAAYILDSEGKPTGVISINRDISALKAHERHQQELNTILGKNMDLLTAANRELESFSYSVSHDLRAPLRGIDGWSLALIEDYGHTLDDQARQYLERVRSETKRMDLLVDAMLDLSRISRAEMQPERTDISAIARTIASRLSETEKNRNVEWRIEPDLSVLGDPALVEIALSNLLGNAYKFTKKTENAHIEFGQNAADPRKPFFIRDNGAGFDMGFAKKLFGAFQRMHKTSDFAGTGVGLATVQRIIHRHGGEIWAEAEVNKGATFYFTIGEKI
jgi:PAS domain S-box-containing protein